MARVQNPGVDAICGLSLLLVLSLAPRGFSPGTPVFPSPQKRTFPNSNSTRNQVDEEPLSGRATSKSLFRDRSKSMGGGGGGPEHLEMWLIKNT